MKKIGIIICARYINCGGGKCFRAMRERVGGFRIYPKEEEIRLVGYSNCGGCPGGNIEYVTEEMKKNGAEAIHLATGFIVGYPPCPWMTSFKDFIEVKFNIPVVLGTHPIPMKYLETHKKLSFWKDLNMEKSISHLLEEDEKIMIDYN